ncbi:immunoglobulin-like domain-containing protein [Paenilisteria newyorkensis]|uniref:immunoglobulin-like domain-containing protein n=1 Tax=Listeria newyorkensis TaxID=1497681 RepID=UPI002358F583|nr:immunoglobulin-like domain-containing protein [Listeria newyorkensis]WAO22705.1 toxin Cry1Ac domain D-VI-related protein [Listeria newyorkensis]
MKMKKLMSVVALTSIIGTSVVTPFNVLATPAAASEQANSNNVTNPNLFKISTEMTKLADGKYKLNWNSIATTNAWTWNEASNVFSKVETSKNIVSLAVEKDTAITLKNDLKNFAYVSSNSAIGQPVATEIGKEYTVSTDFDIVQGSTLASIQIYNESPVANLVNTSKNANTGTMSVTFKATQKTTFIGFGAYGEKGTIKEVRYSNISMVKSDAQVAKDDVATQNTAREAVNNLFENKNPQGNITSAVTEDSIANAQNLVDQVVDVTKKAELQADLDKAKAQLADKVAKAQAEKEAEEKAREAVNNLFENKDPNGTITTGITQADITNAQTLINQVTDTDKKAGLQADLEKAKTQLADKEAQAQVEKEAQDKAREAVNNLFENKDPNGTITTGITQADITNAQTLIDQVTDADKKAALQADLEKAKTQLAEKEAQAQAEKEAQDKAREAVNNLFENKDPNGTITTGITQADITNAQTLINQVTDADKKAGLQADLEKAKTQLAEKEAQAQAEKEAQDKAREAVNNLFENKDPNGTITTGITQADITTAQNLINQVMDANKKVVLQADLDKAKAQLADKEAQAQAEKEAQDKAREAVNNLFENNNPKGDILTGITQEDIAIAQNLVNKVTDPATKAALQADLDKAKQQVADRLATTGTVKTDAFTIGTDKYVTGTYTGDVARISLFQDGVEYKGATVKNGTFSFYAADKKIKKDQTIIMTAYDKYGKELAQEKVTFVVPTEGKITPNEMTIPGDKNITGTYTDDVKSVVVTVNGTVYKGGTVANGEFKFYSQDKIKAATDKVTIQAFDSVGKLLDTKTVKIKAPVVVTAGDITLDTYTVGDKNITGMYTGDVKSVVVTVNGAAYKGGTFNADGTFKFYALDKIKSADDVIAIQAFDKAGKVLDTQTINIQK